MTQPTPREVLDRVAQRMLAVPRARIVNRADRDALPLADVLRVIEEAAAAFGEQQRQWGTDSSASTGQEG